MKTRFVILTTVLAGMSVAQAWANDSTTSSDDRRAKFHEKMDERWKGMDTNADGNISKSEFLAKSEERFNKMDANSDGQISSAERDAMIAKFKKMHGKDDDGKPFP